MARVRSLGVWLVTVLPLPLAAPTRVLELSAAGSLAAGGPPRHGVPAEQGPRDEDLLKEEGVLGDHAKVRTALDPPMPAPEALERLKQGNARYVSGEPLRSADAEMRTALAEKGQNPMAVVLGCADSRCPVETIVDAQPGEVFVLRSAGNACPGGEASIVGSAEFAVGALRTRLVVVMGHTKCGAIKGASQLVLDDAKTTSSWWCCQTEKAPCLPKNPSALDKYLRALTPPAKEALDSLGGEASMEEVAGAAVYANVWHTIESLLEHSEPLRESARSGGLELHGAVYHIETGVVEFLGQHPGLKGLL